METSMIFSPRADFRQSSHSLGTLIEWKRHSLLKTFYIGVKVPTRWGH
ncbi:MAG: hypothetical protein O1I36_17725 [Cylindrospermopsis raciborskii PAMP2011]|nr:hypothetical protein [Cylindrospermopsis raciborskii PAMP2011]